MKKVAIYARVSSKEQAEEGVSIPAQIKQLKQYAIEHGYDIAYEFVDRGESARTADRPEFQRMIATAKKKPKPFDIILIHKTDRFARNREDSIIYKSLLRKQCGIDVVSITEKFDDTPQGKMMEGIMEVVAEFYSANLSKEVMKGMTEQASKGIALGEPPYGYKIDEDTGKFDIYEPEAKVVRYIYSEYINGGSYRSIGIDLRKNGKNMFGKAALKKVSKAIGNEGKHKTQQLKWRPNSIKRILNNKNYTGDFVWNGEIIKNNHPSIISYEDFKLVQELLKKNRRVPKLKSKDYLLKGIVTCLECGGSLSQLNQRYTTTSGEERIYRKLRCSNHVRMANCYPNSHDMSEIEQNLVSYLKEVVNSNIDPSKLDIKKTQENNLFKRHNQLQNKYDNFDQRFDRQVEAYESGVINLEQLQKYKERLEDEKKELEAELEKLENKLNAEKVDYNHFLDQLKKVINIIEDESINLQKKKNSLLTIVSEIKISGQKDLMRVIFKY